MSGEHVECRGGMVIFDDRCFYANGDKPPKTIKNRDLNDNLQRNCELRCQTKCEAKLHLQDVRKKAIAG